MFHFFTSEKNQGRECFTFLLRKKPKVRSVSFLYFGKNPKSEVLHFLTSENTKCQKCFTFLLQKKTKVGSISLFDFGKNSKSEVFYFFTSEKTQSRKYFTFLLRKKLKHNYLLPQYSYKMPNTTILKLKIVVIYKSIIINSWR